MRKFSLLFLIPAIIAIIVGLYTMEAFNLNFLNILFSREQIVWFTGLTAAIAGCGLVYSSILNTFRN